MIHTGVRSLVTTDRYARMGPGLSSVPQTANDRGSSSLLSMPSARATSALRRYTVWLWPSEYLESRSRALSKVLGRLDDERRTWVVDDEVAPVKLDVRVRPNLERAERQRHRQSSSALTPHLCDPLDGPVRLQVDDRKSSCEGRPTVSSRRAAAPVVPS